MTETKLATLNTFAQFFEARKSALAQVLPKYLTPERVVRVALSAFQRNLKLLQCTPESVYLAIHSAAQIGLEAGSALGHAYLVPYKSDCTLIVGYKGFVAIAWRTASILLTARVIHENDSRDVEYGDDEHLTHKPKLDGERGAMVAAYCIAEMPDGRKKFDVMTKAEIDAIRARSRAANDGPWVTDYEEMAKKTVIRRLFKTLPCSDEMEQAVAIDERGNMGDVLELPAPELRASRADELADTLEAPKEKAK